MTRQTLRSLMVVCLSLWAIASGAVQNGPAPTSTSVRITLIRDDARIPIIPMAVAATRSRTAPAIGGIEVKALR